MPSPLGLIRQALPAALGTLATVSVVSWMLYYRYRRQDVYCDVCDMWLNSQKQYKNHLTTKKHKKNYRKPLVQPTPPLVTNSRIPLVTNPNEEDWRSRARARLVLQSTARLNLPFPSKQKTRTHKHAQTQTSPRIQSPARLPTRLPTRPLMDPFRDPRGLFFFGFLFFYNFLS